MQEEIERLRARLRSPAGGSSPAPATEGNTSSDASHSDDAKQAQVAAQEELDWEASVRRVLAERNQCVAEMALRDEMVQQLTEENRRIKAKLLEQVRTCGTLSIQHWC